MNEWFTPQTAAISAERLRPWACLFVHLWRNMEQDRSGSPALEGPVSRGYFSKLQDLLFVRDLLRVYGVEPAEPEAGLFRFESRRAGEGVWIEWSLFESPAFRWSAAVPGSPSRKLDLDGTWDSPC